MRLILLADAFNPALNFSTLVW